MISSKINQLQARDRTKFIETLVEYDSEVDRACSTIKKTLTKMVEKQYELANTFVELIDEVLRVKSVNTDNDVEAPQLTKPSDTSHHVSSSDLPTL
jgi:meiotically up-regulated gene 157 (Mug157) protein